MISPLQTAAEQEAIKHCPHCWTWESGKHFKMRLNGPHGELGTVVVSKSPSCPFAQKKVARDVRHTMRRIGYAM